MRRSRAAVLPLLAGLVAASAAVSAPAPAAADPLAPGLGVSSDFDGDGFADLAIGAPFDDTPAGEDTGAVNVLYGSPSGITSRDDQYVTQAWIGRAAARPGDYFGGMLSSADFDGDGFADLVVGAPFADVTESENDGIAVVVFGSAGGLDPSRMVTLSEDSPGIAGTSEGDDGFGSALGVGDFDADGFADLAVGIRGEGASEESEESGAVVVVAGGPGGLVTQRSRRFDQSTPGIADEPEPADRFGVAVEGGDFDGDGYDDLAVGAHGEDFGLPGAPGAIADAGAVHVLRGSAGGVTAAGSAFLDQSALGGVAEEVDLFGSDLASGDLDGDGYDDLAVSAFAEDLPRAMDAGAVNVGYGGPGGVGSGGAEEWHQNVPGIRGVAQDQDSFGVSLAAGDLNADGFDDLASGVQGEDDGGVFESGAVAVILGSGAGLRAGANLLLGQDSQGIEETSEEFDFWGTEVAIGDLGRGAAEDLAVGSRESLPGADVAGSVSVIYGLSGDGDQVWNQDTKGVTGRARPFDFLSLGLRAA
jgi:hypothetical protein